MSVSVPARASAMRCATTVFPVPHAMITWPRAVCARPFTASATAGTWWSNRGRGVASVFEDAACEGEGCAGEGVGHPVAGVWIVVVMARMCAARRQSPAIGLSCGASPRTGAPARNTSPGLVA